MVNNSGLDMKPLRLKIYNLGVGIGKLCSTFAPLCYASIAGKILLSIILDHVVRNIYACAVRVGEHGSMAMLQHNRK